MGLGQLPSSEVNLNNKIIRLLTAVAIASLTIGAAACASSPKTSQAVMDYSTLLANLRASAVSVKEGEEVKQPFFSVKGRIVAVDGNDIQVFEYPTPAKMETESKYVSPDGYSFTAGNSVTNVSWIAPPHLYKAGRIMVIYVGIDKTITGLLENILGKQFAGA